MSEPVACSVAERDHLAALWQAHQRAERDLRVAFTTFCLAHGIPDCGAQLLGIGAESVTVQRPSEPLPHG